MASIALSPYLTPRPERVSIGVWRVAQDGEALGDLVRGWDPNLNLQLTNQLVVDTAQVREECRLLDDDVLGIAAGWHSSGTSIRRGRVVKTFRAGEPNTSVDLEMLVPGVESASELRLISQLIFLKAGFGKRSPLAATVTGTRLWRSIQKTSLEGRGARFPIEIVSFTQLGWLPPKAAWHLDWNKDAPEAFLLASVRLLVNQDHEAVRSAVALSEIASIGIVPILSAIHFDVGRQLIMGMLSSVEFVSDASKYEKGTVGYHVRALVSRLFPGESISSVAALARERQSFFDSRLQAKLGLFY